MLEVAKHPSPPGNRRPTMTEAYDGRQVVGMDLHRRRSVLVRMTEDGRKLEIARIADSPQALRAVIARAGKTRGWWSRRHTAGTGQLTCWRRPGRGGDRRIRWGPTRSAARR